MSERIAWFPRGSGDLVRRDVVEWGAEGGSVLWMIARQDRGSFALFHAEGSPAAWAQVGGQPFERVEDAKRRADQLLPVSCGAHSVRP